MRIAILECFAGISGDMMMAALADAGAPLDLLKDTASSLGLGAELRVSKVDRSGIQSSKIDVLVDRKLEESAAASGPHPDGHTHGEPAAHSLSTGHDHRGNHSHAHGAHGAHTHGRTWKAIRRILLEAPLPEPARQFSLKTFQLLAEAEGRIHGIPPDDIHFHEVGGVDAIVDIVCCAVAVDWLAADRWYCSPVNVGGGFVDCAHGRFPIPAPATAELLKDIPRYSSGPHVEMVTPTGAALLRALQCRFEFPGSLRGRSIGYGAGSRNPERFPNVLRLTIGDLAETRKLGQEFEEEKVTVLECAIDDLSPQVLAYAAQRAMESGALDVMTAPVTMKKGRLGSLMTVLCRASDAEDLQRLLFRETTTLGMRVREESRICLSRKLVPVETEFGTIHVKIGFRLDEAMNASPEYEDCRRAAEIHSVPLKLVIQAALDGWRRTVGTKVEAGAP